MSELRFYTEPSTTSATMDRRRSPRAERKTSAWLSAPTNGRQAAGLNVSVLDLSLHGVGFVSERELKKNDQHWMVIADGALRLSTRLRIVNVREKEGKWEIGAEFF